LASLAATNSRPENHFSRNRQPPAEAAFDNSNGSCEGRAIFEDGLLMKVAKPESSCFEQRGSLPSQRPTIQFSIEMSWGMTIDGGSRLGADDVAGAF
jgi:hypothetical protein